MAHVFMPCYAVKAPLIINSMHNQIHFRRFTMQRTQKSAKYHFLLSVTACLILLALAVVLPAAAEEVTDENLFDMNDPLFVEGYNFVASTELITAEEHSFITGYIPVTKGDIISLNLHSTKDSDFIKYAVFDENKQWVETFKYYKLSELNIRIFESGYIRLSVYGLEFEDTVTIYRTKDRQEEEAENDDVIVVTRDSTNIIVQTTQDDHSEDWIDRLDRFDPDFLDKKCYEAQTDVIVDEENSFLSGYIPVQKGDNIILALNSSRNAPFVKYALYNTEKEWQQTVKLFDVPELVLSISEPGFVRIAVNDRVFKSTAAIYRRSATTLYADQQISDVILPSITATKSTNEAFNKNYLSGEMIDLFDMSDPDFVMNKGYRQLTGEIVDDNSSFLSGFIPVVNGQVVVVTMKQQSDFAKYVLFDQNMNWISTTRVDHPTMLVVPISESGYFRFHGHDNAINGTMITIPTVTKLDINSISGNLSDRLERLEAAVPTSQQVDVMIFMGQSNMAGRGEVTEEHPEDAPAVINGAGWEFRAVSDPTMLYPIDKTFGRNENVEDAINDNDSKTGSLVPSFINAYYTHNGSIPVIAISASEGATSIVDWQPGTARLNDAINRLNLCINWLKASGYSVRHQYMVWCQGENDVLHTHDWYIDEFNQMLNDMKAAGIEKCFLIRTGNSNPAAQEYIDMMSCQNRICKESRDTVLVSVSFSAMLEKGLMKDQYHYYQEAYNICGEDAGINAAYYATTGKEPMIFDSQFNTLYISEVN